MMPRKFPREIRVDIRDADGVLLRDSRLRWSEDGSDRGIVHARDGHATLLPASDKSTVEITVEYDGKAKTEKLNMRGMKASRMTFRSWLEFYFETFNNSLIMRTDVQRLHDGKRFRVLAIKTGSVLLSTADVLEAIRNLIQFEGQFRPIECLGTDSESPVAGCRRSPK